MQVCSNEDSLVPNLIGAALINPQFSSSTGLVINQLTGVVNIAQSQAGNYQIELATQSCTADTLFNVEIFDSNLEVIYPFDTIC